MLTCLNNDTSRYLDDILTIDNPEFEKKTIFLIYAAELQLKKANSRQKDTLFLYENIKAIDDDNISVYYKRKDSEFPIVNFPWFSDERFHPTVVDSF